MAERKKFANWSPQEIVAEVKATTRAIAGLMDQRGLPTMVGQMALLTTAASLITKRANTEAQLEEAIEWHLDYFTKVARGNFAKRTEPDGK